MSKIGILLMIVYFLIYIFIVTISAYNFWNHDLNSGIPLFIFSQVIWVKLNKFVKANF